MTKEKKILPYGRQCISEDDVAAVSRVLRGDWLTTGPMVEAFESAVAEATGAQHAICCSSGTAGLHMATMAVKLEPESFTIVPSITFLATANAVRFTGAEVLFADVDPETGLLTPETFSEALDQAAGEGKDVRAVMPVHLTGQSCDMQSIAEMARSRGISIIEDAAHALGASYEFDGGEAGKVGDCHFSDLAVFSTHPVKSITTGEGGFVTTSDEKLARRLSLLRNHAMERDTEALENANMAFDSQGDLNPWYYEMHELAPNYRLTDIHCSLGVAQLSHLQEFIDRRNELVRHYDALLGDLAPAVRPLVRRPGGRSASHLYVVLIDFAELGRERAKVMADMKANGIGTQVHYIPVHSQPYYQRRYGSRHLPGTQGYYEKALTLPLFVGMTDADAERAVDALRQALGLR